MATALLRHLDNCHQTGIYALSFSWYYCSPSCCVCMFSWLLKPLLWWIRNLLAGTCTTIQLLFQASAGEEKGKMFEPRLATSCRRVKGVGWKVHCVSTRSIRPITIQQKKSKSFLKVQRWMTGSIKLSQLPVLLTVQTINCSWYKVPRVTCSWHCLRFLSHFSDDEKG